MLSEKKKRQRISVDPQNTTWHADTTSYGHRLLERMGWKKGDGLGKDADGATAHPAVEAKSDNKGIGFSTEKSKASAATCIGAFDALLKDINSVGGVSGKQKRSKKASSRRRPHEQETARLSHRTKYIKSKSVSTYPDQSLAEILGFAKQLQSKID